MIFLNAKMEIVFENFVIFFIIQKVDEKIVSEFFSNIIIYMNYEILNNKTNIEDINLKINITIFQKKVLRWLGFDYLC